MKAGKVIGTLGTYLAVGVAAAASAALWTYVLDGKIQMTIAKLTNQRSDKVIFVDFKKAKRNLGR